MNYGWLWIAVLITGFALIFNISKRRGLRNVVVDSATHEIQTKPLPPADASEGSDIAAGCLDVVFENELADPQTPGAKSDAEMVLFGDVSNLPEPWAGEIINDITSALQRGLLEPHSIVSPIVREFRFFHQIEEIIDLVPHGKNLLLISNECDWGSRPGDTVDFSYFGPVNKYGSTYSGRYREHIVVYEVAPATRLMDCAPSACLSAGAS